MGESIKVEDSAKDLYLKDLADREKNRPKFNPRMTDTFKDTYTDNVIYTNRFKDLWLTDELQRDWTIAVDDVIVNKLGLKDYKVIDYISEEFKLVRELINIRQKIRPDNETEKIEEMRQFEKESNEKLKTLLEGDNNFKVMQKSMKKFFIQYKNSHPQKDLISN